MKKINALYHSEITNAKEFRKEYKQISSNYRKKLTGNYKKAITDEEPKKKGKGGGVSIISLVCGLTGLIVAGLILGTLAITFGLIGLLQGKRPQMALIGLVIGIIDIAAVMIALGLF